MNEVARIKQKIAAIEAEQQQAERNWQRCDGALQALRHMLGEAMREEDAAPAAKGADDTETCRKRKSR